MLLTWVSKYDGRGTAAARKDFGKLGKAFIATRLGALGTFYAIEQAVTAVGRLAAAEQTSITQLNKTLENANFGNYTTQVNDFIAGMQKSTGIIDNELRPAFVQLFNSIGDVGAAEQLLAKSTDYAAGTGKSLDTVITALGRAFAGNRESLNELNTGLDKTFLKTASLSEIVSALDAKFAGQAAASIDTYAGKFNRLSTILTSSLEQLGKGLLDSLNMSEPAMVDFEATISNLADISLGLSKIIRNVDGFIIDKMGPAIRMFNDGLGVAARILNDLGGAWDSFVQRFINPKYHQKKVVDQIGTLHDSITGLGASPIKSNALDAYLAKVDRAAKAKAAADAAKERADKAAKLRQAALDKAIAEKTMTYDQERASLTAALGKTTSADNAKRIQDLLEINTATYAQDLGLTSISQIQKLIDDQLTSIVKKQQDWAKASHDTAAGWATLANNMAAIKIGTGTTAGILAGGDIITNALGTLKGQMDAFQGTLPSGGQTVQQQQPPINVTITGSMIAQQDLEEAIARAVNSSARNGSSFNRLSTAIAV